MDSFSWQRRGCTTDELVCGVNGCPEVNMTTMMIKPVLITTLIPTLVSVLTKTKMQELELAFCPCVVQKQRPQVFRQLSARG